MVLNSQFSRLKILYSSLNHCSHSIKGKTWSSRYYLLPQWSPSSPPVAKSLMIWSLWGPDMAGSQAHPGFKPELDLLTLLKIHSNAKLFLMSSVTCNHSLLCNLRRTFNLSHDMSNSGFTLCMKLVFYTRQEPPLRSGNVSGACLAKSKAWCLINNGIYHALLLI